MNHMHLDVSGNYSQYSNNDDSDPLLSMISCDFPNNSCKYAINDAHSLSKFEFHIKVFFFKNYN